MPGASGKIHDLILMRFRLACGLAVNSVSSRWLFYSDKFRVVHTQDKGNAMPNERALVGNVFELNAGNRKRKFQLERNQNSERVQLVEAIDRVSSAFDELLSVLDGRRGH